MTDASFAGLTALVVDDEPFTRLVMVKVVQSLGFTTVLEAAHGEAGLAILSTHPVQVMICDMEMRPLTGIDVLRRLRASPPDQDRVLPQSTAGLLPVLFISNRVDSETRVEAVSLGRVAFLDKPVQAPQLRATLLDLLRG